MIWILVIEAKRFTLVTESKNTTLVGNPKQSAIDFFLRVVSTSVRGNTWIKREQVLDVRQYQFLMLLLVMEAKSY